MLIDWFTVAAQIVNFLVLVFFLRHFLWKRLIRAMDDREHGIAARLAEAEDKNKDAERAVEQARGRLIKIDQQREGIIAETKKEADEQRSQMLVKAREDVRRQAAVWSQDLEREQAAFLDDVRRRMASEMLAIVRRALADLASASVERCALQVFIEQVGKLDAATLFDFATGDITVLSAFEISAEDQRALQEALEARLKTKVALKFERAPAMAWGLELRAKGHRIGWNSEAYIASLEQSLKETLEQQRNLVAVG